MGIRVAEFDHYVKNYRDIHNKNIKRSGADSDYFCEYKITEITKHLNSQLPLKILDLGCGDGNSARYFGKNFPHATIEGIDISEKSIQMARKRQTQRSHYQVYDGQHIPFATSHFDLILISCVLHHVLPSSRLSLMKEVLRVLNSEGLLFIFEHNPFNPVTRHIVNTCEFDKDAVLLSAQNGLELVKEAGFQQITFTYTIFFPRHSWFQPLLRLERYLGWFPLGGQYYLKVKGV
jgi:ubiquinone/menaquinone biosynthesis C-methylase UbiE